MKPEAERRNMDDFFGNNGNDSNQNTQRRWLLISDNISVDFVIFRTESVRASLKKHYDYLEKYAGQKVATVAPQNN